MDDHPATTTESAEGAPATEAKTEHGAGPRLARSRAGDIAMRGLLILAGAGLIVGFFMPWLTIGTLASISGLGLMVADGEAVAMISGSHRVLLFAVPLLGAGLIFGGITGHRAAAWLALITGVVVVGDGLLTLIRLFFDTTGAGMWLVILCSLTSLGLGLLAVGRKRA